MDAIATLVSLAGPAGTAAAVAAIPIVAGVAVYITRMGSQAKIDRLEGDLDRLRLELADKQALSDQKYTELDSKYQAMLQSGALIQVQLDAIVSEVADIADRLGATDYSVLVAAPSAIPGDTPDQLVFLCASGAQSAKLRWVRVPISNSLSGAVFRSGRPTIASPPPSGGTFASRTDKIIDFKTNEVLSVCLRHRNQAVGVAQFLNKRSGRFQADDTDRALDLCSALALRVGDFMSDPRRIMELGHAPRRNRSNVTIAVVDLSRYADLFHTLDSSVITDLLNQYFQDLCTIAIDHGATIDQTMGDGILLVFNPDQNKTADELAAVNAALEMRKAFHELRQRWVTLGYAGTEALRVRFGLSYGLVTRAEVGHTQARRMTVIGPAINEAAHVCELAPRDRDTVCITDTLRDALSDQLKEAAQPLTGASMLLFELPADQAPLR